MGYKVVEYVPGKFAAVKDMNESFLKNLLPYYSQDGNAVLELDKEIKSRGWLLILRAFADRKVKASYWQHGKDECNPCVPGSGVAAIAETIPKAIALAARHALRVSVNLEGNCK